MAAVRHLGLLFATLDHPRRLLGDRKRVFKLVQILGIRPADAPNPILAIFVMWGGPPDVFLKF